jgi:hypothetical protein
MDWVGFHLVVPRAMTVEESHDICDRIERAIRREIAGAMITIHVEPAPKVEEAPCIPIAEGGGGMSDLPPMSELQLGWCATQNPLGFSVLRN